MGSVYSELLFAQQGFTGSTPPLYGPTGSVLVIRDIDGYGNMGIGDTARLYFRGSDEEVFAFVNDQERGVGTYLYGRRMYETMRYWETVSLDGQPAVIQDYTRIWRSADKIVYSTTLKAVSSARTRIETSLDPEAVRELKRHGDISVGGPGLAASVIRAGLVDEYHLFVVPMVVGGGTAVFPDGVRARLDLVDQHRFAGGFVYLRYRARD